jgi:hypothetical protein
MTHSEIEELIERIDNWRRFYRVTQRLCAVPYYTPPVAGEVMQEDRLVKISPDMKDAIRLESSWRVIEHQPKKQFIKLQYIKKLDVHAIKRIMRKRFDERIGSDNEYLLYDLSALELLDRKINCLTRR